MLYKNHHTALWSATGLGSLNSNLKSGHPLRLRRWPERLAVCFLCRARVRTSDFRYIVLRYVKWIFLLSIAVSLNWAETGNCRWLLFFSIFPPCVQTNFDNKWSSSDAGKLKFQFSHFYTISFNVAEKGVHISSLFLVCVCTFLLVDKIVYGLLAFCNARFSFWIKSFQMFTIILNWLGEFSSSSSIFEISVKFQSF